MRERLGEIKETDKGLRGTGEGRGRRAAGVSVDRGCLDEPPSSDVGSSGGGEGRRGSGIWPCVVERKAVDMLKR